MQTSAFYCYSRKDGEIALYFASSNSAINILERARSPLVPAGETRKLQGESPYVSLLNALA